jgi:type VI secretion system secreted protein Hcp
MAVDAFLKIGGIEGESTASSAGGASEERVDFNGFGFTKSLDKASPLLALACASGKHIDTIVLELCRAGSVSVLAIQTKTQATCSVYYRFIRKRRGQYRSAEGETRNRLQEL